MHLHNPPTTPADLQEAVRGSQREIVQLLVKEGGLIYEDKSVRAFPDALRQRNRPDSDCPGP